MMRHPIILIAFLLSCCLGAAAQQEVVTRQGIGDRYPRFSILGDSFSTYSGLCPVPWFPHDDIQHPFHTWWKLFECESGSAVEQNDSWSGSCISYIGLDGSGTEVNSSYVNRVKSLRKADLFIIEGGTNDGYRDQPGSFKYGNWTENDFKYFRPAVAYVIDYLQNKYPEARLVFFLNNHIRQNYRESVHTICDHYGITVYDMAVEDKDMEGVHPTRRGMYLINHQLQKCIDEADGWRVFDETYMHRQADDETVGRAAFHITLEGKQWQGLCLPFNADAAMVSQIFGEGTKIAAYASTEGTTMHFRLTDRITAHQPVLIYPARTLRNTFYINNLQLIGGSAQTLGEAPCQLTGLYIPRTVAANNKTQRFVGPDAQPYISTESVEVNSFTAYFRTGSSTDLSVVIDDDVYFAIEAEQCEMFNRAGSPALQRVADEFSSGGYYMGNMGNGNRLSFVFDAPVAGTYNLGITYMTVGQRTVEASLTQIGTGKRSVECATTGSWDAASHQTAVIPLELVAGQNTIYVRNAASAAPNVDRLTLDLQWNGQDAAAITDIVSPPAVRERSYDLMGRPTGPHPAPGIYVDASGRKVVRK